MPLRRERKRHTEAEEERAPEQLAQRDDLAHVAADQQVQLLAQTCAQGEDAGARRNPDVPARPRE